MIESLLIMLHGAAPILMVGAALLGVAGLILFAITKFIMWVTGREGVRQSFFPAQPEYAASGGYPPRR